MKSKKCNIYKKEDYYVKAMLTFDDVVINNIPCKVFLPEKILEKPYLLLYPSSKQMEKIRVGNLIVAISIEVKDILNSITLNIVSSEVYLSDLKTSNLETRLFENTIIGEPQNLHVVNHIPNKIESNKCRLQFWLNTNTYISPAMLNETSYTGEIKIDRQPLLEFQLLDDLKISFDKYFKQKESDVGELIQWGYLVGVTELFVSAEDQDSIIKNYLSVIDDFLLIISFLTRIKTACVGWDAFDSKCETQFFRGDYAFPYEISEDRQNNALVIEPYLKSIAETSYSNFVNSKFKNEIRNTIQYLISSKEQVLEMSYIQKFAGLETLILKHKRETSSEFVVEADKWLGISAQLKKYLRGIKQPVLKKEERAVIYQKLPELNRVSLNKSYTLFCESYSINETDLWPLFKDKNGVGLVDIRNRIVHGDPFPPGMIDKLVVANLHLEYLLERIIIKVLGCDIEKTRARTSVITNYSFMNNYNSARSYFTSII